MSLREQNVSGHYSVMVSYILLCADLLVSIAIDTNNSAFKTERESLPRV